MTLDDVLTATREVAAPEPATIDRGQEAAMTAFHQDLAARARIARRKLRRGVLSGVAVLAAAAVIAAVAANPDPDTRPIPDVIAAPKPQVVDVQYANASQIVNAAADASGRTGTVLGDAPYWKVMSEYQQKGGRNVDENSTGRRTIWQGIDRPSVLADSQFGDEIVALPKSTLQVGGRSYTWREINDGALSSEQIRGLLTAGEMGTGDKPGRAPHEWYFFKQAGELLTETPASPAIRKAIWKELASVSGATTSGKVVDATGREGWNLTYAAKGYGTQRFIVDPESGAILQGETEMRGTTYRVTYLSAGPATSAPKVTPGGKY